MRFLHGAALAILGWYLMVPPTIPDTHEVNKTAPLSQWTIRRSFPHGQGCEMAKDRVRKAGFAHLTELDTMGRRGQRNRESFCVACNAECVEDNDPRLKGE